MACGVGRKDIADNYVISREYNRKRLEAFLAVHPEAKREVCLANEKSMNCFIDLFNERFGTVEGYFEAVGASAGYAEMIRNKLI